MGGIGDHEFGCRDGFAAHPGFGERGSDQRRGEAFTQAGDRIVRARRQLPQQSRALAQPFALLKNLFQFAMNLVAERDRVDQSFGDGAMPAAEFLEYPRDRFAIACLGLCRGFDQFIGHAAHGRHNHHQIAVASRLANDLDHVPDAGRVPDRRPPELHDAQRLDWVRVFHVGHSYVEHGDTYRFPDSACAARLAAGAAILGDATAEAACLRGDREYQALCLRRLLTQSRINSGSFQGTS